ncbi:MAG: hypothetical protein IPK12_24470 [Gemmatimonadetes bacterium]|nr:hypothetical protein [Gemmatimonadota bacterium]
MRQYIITQTGLDLDGIFRQYLTTTWCLHPEVKLHDGRLEYRWTEVVDGFVLPLPVHTGPDQWTTLTPTTEWQSVPISHTDPAVVQANPTIT